MYIIFYQFVSYKNGISLRYGFILFFVILSFCFDVLFSIVLLRCLILLSYYDFLVVCGIFNFFLSLYNINKQIK